MNLSRRCSSSQTRCVHESDLVGGELNVEDHKAHTAGFLSFDWLFGKLKNHEQVLKTPNARDL